MSLIDNIKKLVTPTPKTVDELRPIVHLAAQLSYDISVAEAKMKSHASVVLKEYGGLIATLKKQYIAAERTILKFFATNRDLFGDGKTVDIDGHKVAIRNSPGKVVCTINDNAACDAIVATNDNELILGALCTEIVPDRKTIKAILDAGGPMAETLTKIGFSIERGETISFKPAEPNDGATTL